MKVAGNAAAPVGSLRLLPLFLGVLLVALVFRVGDFAGDVGKVVTAARAQEAADPVPPADRHEADAAASEAGPEPDAPAPEATDATALPLAGISRAEMSLLQDLRARRQELEDRERKVALQEQLLATTERRIDQRIAEMQKIEKRIAELVAQHDAREEEQLKSVVSMYEKMSRRMPLRSSNASISTSSSPLRHG